MAVAKGARLARLQARATVFAVLHASPRKNGERSRESIISDAIAIVHELEFGKTEPQKLRRNFARLIDTLPAQVEDGREVKSAEDRQNYAKHLFEQALSRRDYHTAKIIVETIDGEQPKSVDANQ